MCIFSWRGTSPVYDNNGHFCTHLEVAMLDGSSSYFQLEWLPFLQFDGHILLSAKYITNDWTEEGQWHNVTASGSTQQELGSYLSSRNRSKSLKHLTSVNIARSRADQWDSDLSWKSHWSDWSSYMWWPSQPLTWPSASFLCPSIFLINISSIFFIDVLQNIFLSCVWRFFLKLIAPCYLQQANL